jgi:curved DNA-binding protein CbpA
MDRELSPEDAAAEATDLERILGWDDVLDDATYYEILGLDQSATHDDLRHAFHRFALAFHPDVFRDADEDTQSRVRRVFERGVESYRMLIDERLRADYDLCLAKGELRLGHDLKREGVGVGAKSIDEVCRSPAAKLYAKRAAELIAEGELKAAHLELWRALRAEDGPNPELVERIQAVEDLMLLTR